MEIGFKSVFLLEILANISSQDVNIELAEIQQEPDFFFRGSGK
jgi:hypothetical protein